MKGWETGTWAPSPLLLDAESHFFWAVHFWPNYSWGGGGMGVFSFFLLYTA